MKLKFTKSNLLNFWNNYCDQKPNEADEDSYFEFIDKVAVDLVDTFELPDFAGPVEDIVVNLLDDKLDYINTEYEAQTNNTTSSSAGLQIVDESNADKEWKKTREVLDNYNQMLSTLKILSADELALLITNLQVSAAEFTVGPGKICNPKKYLANVSKALTGKIPSNILVCEFKIKSSTNANYRAYGFLLNNTLYMLSAYTKTNGQANANQDFDNFIKKLNLYVSTHKLAESLLYSNIEVNIMENENVFEELDTINKIQSLEDHCRGRADATDNKLVEENANSDYMAGYNAVKNEEKLMKFRTWLEAHESDVKAHIRKTLEQ